MRSIFRQSPQTRWTFVPKPPRDRPSAWSGGSWSCASLRPPNHREQLAFFFRPGGDAAGTDDRTIDTPEVVVDETLVIQFVQQRGDHPIPDTVSTPGVEVVEHGLPGPVPFGKITPRRTGVQDPEDPVDDGARFVVARSARFAPSGRIGEKRSDASPLGIGEFIAMHVSTSINKPHNLPRGPNHIIQMGSLRNRCIPVYMRPIFRQSLAAEDWCLSSTREGFDSPTGYCWLRRKRLRERRHAMMSGQRYKRRHDHPFPGSWR